MSTPSETRELLARFEQWLEDTYAQAEELGATGSASPFDAGSGGDLESRALGLYQMVEEFTALRQEVKLQTKSVRDAQDRFDLVTQSLQKATDYFQSVQNRDAESIFQAGKPLVEALAELDEALHRTQTVILQSKKVLVDESGLNLETALKAIFARLPWFARKLFRNYQDQVFEAFRTHGAEVRRQFFETLLEGYGLILRRLDRTLKAEKIQRIPCNGKPVDPGLMTVVEIVDDPDRAPGTVVDEIRRGYTWNGRLVRFAEVRAVRGYLKTPDS